MAMLFCHELDFACRWNLAVYHGGEPRPLTSESADRRTALVPVPAECIRADGGPDLDALAQRFPAPAVAE